MDLTIVWQPISTSKKKLLFHQDEWVNWFMFYARHCVQFASLSKAINQPKQAECRYSICLCVYRSYHKLHRTERLRVAASHSSALWKTLHLRKLHILKIVYYDPNAWKKCMNGITNNPLNILHLMGWALSVMNGRAQLFTFHGETINMETIKRILMLYA